MTPNFKIIWSTQAKESLKDIYQYLRDKSEQGSKNVLSDLLNAPKKIVFAKQYQIDDINPKYRRIVVLDYKIIYLERKGHVEIIDIVSTRQSPDILQDK